MSLEKFVPKEKTLDDTVFEILDRNKNMIVPWYMMAAYAYYVQDDPIISDSLFDRMAKMMLEQWEEIEHKHKHHITKSDLEGGSYLGEYPIIIHGAVESARKIYRD